MVSRGTEALGRWPYRFGLGCRLAVVNRGFVARSLALLSQLTVWRGMEVRLGMRARDVSGAGCGAVSGKRREDRAQRATYNSLSVLGISGDEEGVLGERRQRLGARGIEVIKGLCAACQERRARATRSLTCSFSFSSYIIKVTLTVTRD